jgi:hypothetical protein
LPPQLKRLLALVDGARGPVSAPAELAARDLAITVALCVPHLDAMAIVGLHQLIRLVETEPVQVLQVVTPAEAAP